MARRRVLPLSLSSKYPEVAVLEAALARVPPRERSITVVRWAVALLTGQVPLLTLYYRSGRSRARAGHM